MKTEMICNHIRLLFQGPEPLSQNNQTFEHILDEWGGDAFRYACNDEIFFLTVQQALDAGSMSLAKPNPKAKGEKSLYEASLLLDQTLLHSDEYPIDLDDYTDDMLCQNVKLWDEIGASRENLPKHFRKVGENLKSKWELFLERQRLFCGQLSYDYRHFTAATIEPPVLQPAQFQSWFPSTNDSHVDAWQRHRAERKRLHPLVR